MTLRIIVLFTALMTNTIGWAKVIIEGKINGYDGKSEIYYRPTIEGIYTPYWFEIKPSANGRFTIEFENQGHGITTLSYKKGRYRFFHDSNSKIYLEIKEVQPKKRGRIPGNKMFLAFDSVKQDMTVKIEGDYEAINKFYNRNLRSTYFTTRMVDGNYYSDLIADAATPSSALALLDSMKQVELDQIHQLPKSVNTENPVIEKKEKEIREFLENEVRAFYGAVFLNAMFLKRHDQIVTMIKDSTSDPGIYNRDWEVMIEKLNAEMKANLKPATESPDYLDFIESMAYTLENYKRYEFPQNPEISLDEMVVNRLFKYDTTLFSDPKVRFAYELSGLQLHLNDQLFYSPQLLHAVYDLQARYPGSKHFDFYQPKVEKLRTSLEVAKEDFRKGKIIHANLDSFDALLKRFAGKNVLVDIWATWCHPCVEEFKFKAQLQPLLESDQIEILYISIDKPEWQDRWKQSIRINALEGSHFRADKVFIVDMWNVIGDFEGAIPRYVLIDKQGKIFRSTAARPSEGNELIRQIELLNAQKN